MIGTPSSIPGNVAPRRRCSLDWASLSTKTANDSELKTVRTTVQQTIADHVRRHDTAPITRPGNFGEGIRFTGFGASIFWTTRTQAALNDWDEQGRAVGHVNVQLRGSTGLGGLPLLSSADLLAQVHELGFTSVRRLDLALDVFDHPELTVQRIRDELSAGRWKIPRRSVASMKYVGPIIHTPAGAQGATLYLGDLTSAARVAIYDKGAQQEQEDPWLRIEVRFKGEPAQEAVQRLQQALDAAGESPDAVRLMDHCVVGLIRSAFDVRDVTPYLAAGRLPKNWANAGSSTYPSLMHPVFEQTAPLELGSFKATGVFASRTRHLMRSASRHIWRLAIISAAKGEDPGVIGLTMGAPSAGSITDEDFQDMAQVSGFTIAELEAAELVCHSALFKLHGLDADCIGSDRTQLREELARSLGGV